jgi:glycosyltransferase involved in cell wall biosynthesis
MGLGVSVIIPCYNYGRFLGKAIESAMGQTVPPSKIIVVNDGSTDDTAQVAGRYPVTLINQTNQGPSRTFNAGICRSDTEFFALLSADDLFHPRFLEYTLPALAANPDIGFAYTHAVTFGNEHAVLYTQEYDLRQLGRGGYMGGGCLMRRTAFDAVGGFDPALSHGEDWDLWLSLAEQGIRGKLVPRILFGYRKHGSGLAEKNSLQRRWSCLLRLRSKHSRMLTWRTIARLAAYDVIFMMVKKARQLSPGAYNRLRAYARFARPKLGGVQRVRSSEMDATAGDDYGYGDMMHYLASVGE